MKIISHISGGMTFDCVCCLEDDKEGEEEEDQLVLDRNPLEWSVEEVVQFINSTDCASLANIFQEQVGECRLKSSQHRKLQTCNVQLRPVHPEVPSCDFT